MGEDDGHLTVVSKRGWTCSCEYYNFGFRATCHKCSKARPAASKGSKRAKLGVDAALEVKRLRAEVQELRLQKQSSSATGGDDAAKQERRQKQAELAKATEQYVQVKDTCGEDAAKSLAVHIGML